MPLTKAINLNVTLPAVIFQRHKYPVANPISAFRFGRQQFNYVLQVYTNLLNWSSVSTSTIPVSGTVSLTNAITNYNRRFYRVHLQ